MSGHEPEVRLALALAEYAQLKSEQQHRLNVRDGLIYTALGATLAVLAAGPKTSLWPLLLLALPPATLLMGWVYLANDSKVGDIGTYIRGPLTGQAQQLLPEGDRDPEGDEAPFGWEVWHRNRPHRRAFKIGHMIVCLTLFVVPSFLTIVALILLPGVPDAAVFAGTILATPATPLGLLFFIHNR